MTVSIWLCISEFNYCPRIAHCHSLHTRRRYTHIVEWQWVGYQDQDRCATAGVLGRCLLICSLY